MNQTLTEILSSYTNALNPGAFQSFKNLTALPLLGPELHRTIKTLASPGIREIFTVTEVSESGQVPALRVRNAGDDPVLLLDGEELLGGKQARVMNSSVLVPAGAEIHVPVSCCEAGRWQRQSERFRSHGRSLPSSLKSTKHSRVLSNLRTSERHDADQREIWRDIARYSRARGVQSSTAALGDVFDADRSSLKDYLDAMPALPGQVGLVAFVDNQLAGAEMFASAEIYGEVHNKVLHSFAADAIMSRSRGDSHLASASEVDELRSLLAEEELPDRLRLRLEAALERSTAPSPTKAMDFVQRILDGEISRHSTAGAGTDLRFSHASGNGAALVDTDTLVHLTAFPTVQVSRGRQRHRRSRWN
ncbi:MAG: DUF6569 family protein [Myxococcota bacterium]|nr:DUF6569 family protein [Myxococcota bacterium]